eukprot:270047-Hanusia_phi.AAC.1
MICFELGAVGTLPTPPGLLEGRLRSSEIRINLSEEQNCYVAELVLCEMIPFRFRTDRTVPIAPPLE